MDWLQFSLRLASYIRIETASARIAIAGATGRSPEASEISFYPWKRAISPKLAFQGPNYVQNDPSSCTLKLE
eukprot:294061-Pleurochrysis_carterae.AAC.1